MLRFQCIEGKNPLSFYHNWINQCKIFHILIIKSYNNPPLARKPFFAVRITEQHHYNLKTINRCSVWQVTANKNGQILSKPHNNPSFDTKQKSVMLHAHHETCITTTRVISWTVRTKCISLQNTFIGVTNYSLDIIWNISHSTE